MTEHALGLKTFQVLFAKLKDVSPGNALAQAPQYDKHEHVFELVPEVSFACPAVFRD